MAGAQATTVRETERKYDVGDKSDLVAAGELLENVAGRRRAGRGSTARVDADQALDATYLDTEDLRLLAAGVTLRRRTGGADEGWHLKLPVGGESRDEVRLPLGAGELHNPPSELVALVRVYTRGAALTPVAELHTARRTWLLAGADGQELVSLADDQVVARTMGTQTTTESWREVEVELGESGPPRLLDDIEDLLLRAGVRRSGSRSKLARVLGPTEAVAGTARRATGPSPTAGEVVLTYLRSEIERLRRGDVLVRLEAPDAVHRMRVAARRIRAALRAFDRVLDRQRTAGVVAELRWLGRELAPDRDAEVISARLANDLRELPEELVLGPVHASLTRATERSRADARKATIAALDSDRYLALQESLDELLAGPPMAGRAGYPARRELTLGLRKSHSRLERRLVEAGRYRPGPERDRGLHQARKAAKQVRYAADAAAPVVGKRARRLRRPVKRVNHLLGEHQDTVQARATLWRLATSAGQQGENGFTLGLLHAGEHARAARVERDLPALVDQLRP